jgi:hypothetical protein
MSVCTQPGAISNRGRSVRASGIAAHELVERGLARPVDLETAGLVATDASLAGGHHRDRRVGTEQVVEALDDAQRRDRVREHRRDDIGIRHVDRSRVLRGERHPGDHEQHVDRAAPQVRSETVVQRRDLAGRRHVDALDVEGIAPGFAEVVKRCVSVATYGAVHLVAEAEVLVATATPRPREAPTISAIGRPGVEFFIVYVFRSTVVESRLSLHSTCRVKT